MAKKLKIAKIEIEFLIWTDEDEPHGAADACREGLRETAEGIWDLSEFDVSDWDPGKGSYWPTDWNESCRPWTPPEDDPPTIAEILKAQENE